MATRQRTATITNGPQPVFAVAFSPDGRTLATGSYDATRLWPISHLTDALATLCTDVAPFSRDIWAHDVPSGVAFRPVCN
jgi:WD40 repeat protein